MKALPGQPLPQDANGLGVGKVSVSSAVGR